MQTATSRVLCIAVIAALSCACAARRPPQPLQAEGSLIVLLPEGDEGKAGSVTVSNASGSAQLDEPYEATRVPASGAPSPAATMDEAEVEREFGRVLADLPAPPQSFNLYFYTDSSELTEKSRALLPTVLQAVTNRLIPEVSVIGHTDTTGSAESNFRLGLKRATTVRALLVSAGVDASLITIESHGEADLLKPTPDNTPEPVNRRVEITVK